MKVIVSMVKQVTGCIREPDVAKRRETVSAKIRARIQGTQLACEKLLLASVANATDAL